MHAPCSSLSHKDWSFSPFLRSPAPCLSALSQIASYSKDIMKFQSQRLVGMVLGALLEARQFALCLTAASQIRAAVRAPGRETAVTATVQWRWALAGVASVFCVWSEADWPLRA